MSLTKRSKTLEMMLLNFFLQMKVRLRKESLALELKLGMKCIKTDVRSAVAVDVYHVEIAEQVDRSLEWIHGVMLCLYHALSVREEVFLHLCRVMLANSISWKI